MIKMPAASMAGGACFASPDVCNVPPVPTPTPFPNQASWATAVGCNPVVLIECRPTVVISSQIPVSTGDEAGSAGGVISSLIKGPVTPKEGSSKVYASCQPVVMLQAATAHNGVNANAPVGQHVSASQSKVFVSM